MVGLEKNHISDGYIPYLEVETCAKGKIFVELDTTVWHGLRSQWRTSPVLNRKKHISPPAQLPAQKEMLCPTFFTRQKPRPIPAKCSVCHCCFLFSLPCSQQPLKHCRRLKSMTQIAIKTS